MPENVRKDSVMQSTYWKNGVATSYFPTVPVFTRIRELSVGPKAYLDPERSWLKFKPFSCNVRSWQRTNGYVKTDLWGIVHIDASRKRTYGWKPYEEMDWFDPWIPGTVNGYEFDQSWLQSAQAKSLHNKAVAAFNEALLDSPIDVAVFFGELSETVKMYANTLDRIGRAITAVRRKQFKKAAKILGTGKPKGTSPTKGFADNWLLYRYGVTPHASEMDDLVQHCLSEAVGSKFIYIRKYARQPVRAQTRVVLPNCVGRDIPPVQLDCTRTEHLQGDHKITIGCVVEITNPTIAKLGQYGLLNPLATGWELVPGSFILDWALNIGDLLTSLHAWAGKRMVAGYKSETLKGTIRSAYGYPAGTTKGNSSYRTHVVFPPSSVVRLNRTNRTILTTPPSINIQIDNGLNPKRILDAVTLLHDRIVGNKRSH